MNADLLTYDVVVPTVGRPSLITLLDALAGGPGPLPEQVLLVDDGPDPRTPLLEQPPPASLADRIHVLTGAGRGPAAARNVGWRAARAPWVAFLDDDVVPPEGWRAALVDDLAGLPADVAGSQGRIRVPVPDDRRATDWERNVAGLEHARWATADLAYRREALEAVDGFDERFPRAYREDADLGLRMTAAGWRIVTGDRAIVHPVRPADPWVSVRLQRGNADDPLMRALHGPDWRQRAGVPRGRRPWHLATTGALATAAVALAAGRRRAAAGATAAWAGLTLDFAVRRILPGPRTRGEVATMLVTSLVLPVAATVHWLRGLATLRTRLRQPGPQRARQAGGRRGMGGNERAKRARQGTHPRKLAVLFDRDGTLVHDVPYNGDPEAVEPVADARAALDRLRAAGVPTAVVSNQSGIARGLLTPTQVERVNGRIEDLLGPLGPWVVCPHGPDDGCPCRKPAPGLVVEAALRLGVDVHDCVVIGDIGSDVEAALAAGARGILVPTEVTRDEEIAAAPLVADSLLDAVELALGRDADMARGDAA